MSALHSRSSKRLPSLNNVAAPSAKRVTHANLILAICCMSVLIVGMDVTIVNVALPAIQEDLHARLAGLQWILDAYTLVVASFLMLAGSTSDPSGVAEFSRSDSACSRLARYCAAVRQRSNS